MVHPVLRSLRALSFVAPGLLLNIVTVEDGHNSAVRTISSSTIDDRTNTVINVFFDFAATHY